MIRVFVGFFTTKRIQEAVEKLQSQSERFIKGKWVEPQNFHMTFQFIGEVPQERLTDLLKNLQEIAQNAKAVRIKYRGLGVFPNLDRARVLWIGVSDGHRQLIDLAKSIVRANRQIGIREEGKPFHPHVTICRIKEFDKRALKDLLRQHENTFFGEDLVDKIALVKSSLTAVGPIYTVIEEFYFHG
ncbi:RNA 2',3'-cyclic phosphodiesterase [Pampinifervens florentissimum]|uniref:RNA 2',3'-cyclic phosphodiesterase n=1 Tax=Pampinifervens florentissimum TaxID=1632019 RepID=UPI0013B4A04B|nr:RNA 2',3'-cyclic phosphodiesterase [Hydrogenobacter sp. T-8]QID33256.1 RNA 2',3'-cyclic phosphodiesterase [Hydrogenobacter sp. T-8]